MLEIIHAIGLFWLCHMHHSKLVLMSSEHLVSWISSQWLYNIGQKWLDSLFFCKSLKHRLPKKVKIFRKHKKNNTKTKMSLQGIKNPSQLNVAMYFLHRDNPQDKLRKSQHIQNVKQYQMSLICSFTRGLSFHGRTMSN